MSALAERFGPVLDDDDGPLRAQDPRLLLGREGRVSAFYAPFEHVNRSARLVLVGITPGASQAQAAVDAYRRARRAGATVDAALASAKQTASFSGPMRPNLVDMLDLVGMARALGIHSCASLFADQANLVHYTSALRCPVYRDEDNYNGTPRMLSTPLLRGMVERDLAAEARQLPDALWLPLGDVPAQAIDHLVRQGILASSSALPPLLHPSPASNERIAYFLGRKPREALSTKTNPEKIDAMRAALRARLL